MRAAIAMLAVAVGGCALTAERADECGYTWRRVMPPARLVTVVIAPDTRTWPGICNAFRGWGCTSWHDMNDGAIWAEIRLREPPGAFHACSTIEHEYRHAAGLDHREAHQYVPRDMTR